MMMAYHATGTLAMLFFLFIVNILRKEKPEKIKSLIFLNYKRFRFAFYIAAFGAIAFAVGNVAALYSHPLFHTLHEVTEMMYDLCMMLFVMVLFTVLMPRPKKRI
ncbi:MAG: hypothetical protein V1718_05355 [archaeon]